MSVSALYGSLDTTLWTPSATGTFPLTASVVAWLDCEDTNQIIPRSTGDGHQYVSIFADKITDIRFGAPASHETPRLSNGTASLLINNRNTLHFWEASQQLTPDTALTAALDQYDGHLAELNEPRYAFYVYKPLNYYAGSNLLYMYGDQATGKAYGLAMWVTGSGDLSDTNQYYFMASYGGGEEYRPDETDSNSFYYNQTGVGNLTYHQHSGTSGYMSHDGNQTTGSYSSTTLTTNNFDRDMQFWIGEEIGGGGRGIEFILAEMIMITGSGFSTDERQRVEGYLAHKWGLTGSLAASHPFKTAAPLNSAVTGNVNFSVGAATVGQPGSGVSTSLTIEVQRSGSQGASTGDSYACAATLDQVGGTAVQNTDYSGLPVTVNWEAEEVDAQSFEINGVNTWGANGKTLIVGFTGLTNLGTGTLIPNATATFSNIVQSPGAEEFPSIDSDFTINNFKNAQYGYLRKTDFAPFSKGAKGVQTLKGTNVAYSSSI